MQHRSQIIHISHQCREELQTYKFHRIRMTKSCDHVEQPIKRGVELKGWDMRLFTNPILSAKENDLNS